MFKGEFFFNSRNDGNTERQKFFVRCRRTYVLDNNCLQRDKKNIWKTLRRNKSFKNENLDFRLKIRFLFKQSEISSTLLIYYRENITFTLKNLYFSRFLHPFLELKS